MKERILITGANGQLGSVLTNRLQDKYGEANVIATDLYQKPLTRGQFEVLDATNYNQILFLIKKYAITQIYHMAAILSANGEKNPLATWNLNMNTFFNVLEASRLSHVKKVFFPSSIAVYGKNAPLFETPQTVCTIPSTVYGISKSAGENWSNYYFEKYGLDVRSIRYPGVIGYQSLPGGGTTDYAVDIYHKAVKKESFECFLKASTTLPMIYMDDAIRATIELMDAPVESVKTRTSYNLVGMSFTPNDLFKSIKKILSDFEISYNPDFRQAIANTWPKSIDDTDARLDWGWKPEYDIDKMSQIMIEKLEEYYNAVTV